MEREQDFSELMHRLRSGDDTAAVQVFDRFARKLIVLAREHMDDVVRRKVDPEEIVQSVYRSFFTRYRQGHFELVNWDSLWGMLTTFTIRKCINRVEYFHAQCRDVRREFPLDKRGPEESYPAPSLFDREPTPLEAAILSEAVQQVMTDLEERERQILALHLQGYTVHEISPEVGRSERTVQRLLERIRRQLEALQLPIP
ncbi:MAG TPA: sigma-70 family RNA polymerase sigma factor [Gemmataceae bacterium]|nr:sigma-70 family RNA polymerase sigma factor [Gemmataceae bacterium]